MRALFSTRAAAAVLAVLALAAFRAKPLDKGTTEAPPAEPGVVAMPVDVLQAAYPVEHEAAPEVSRSGMAPYLSWPAPGAITSPFGGGRNHPGIDIDGVTGDPVTAAGEGTVVQAGAPPAAYSGYGNVVVIEHGAGITTLYAHLSRVDVAVGQAVGQGLQIGAIGSTGASSGDHLHFEVRLLDKHVDPMSYLPARS